MHVGIMFPFSTAFQPIVDVQAGIIVACEALAREPKGEPASSVVDKTLHNNRYATDQRCRGNPPWVTSVAWVRRITLEGY